MMLLSRPKRRTWMRPRPVAARISLICALAMFSTHSAVEAIPTAIPASQSPMDVLPGRRSHHRLGFRRILVAGVAWGQDRIQLRQQPYVGSTKERSHDRSACRRSSPSGKVCWVVGRGRNRAAHYRQGKALGRNCPLPQKSDLVGAYAEDTKRASVWTTSHKQSFETNDGGVTWTANADK